MKSADLVKLLNLHESTLRKYAQDFGVYLSPSGAGGAGHHREYSERDVRVLKLIRDMKADRDVKPADIEATLSSLAASNWERLPTLDESSQAIIPTPSAVIAASQRESAMQREIEVLREMLGKATADRDELLTRVARAELELEMYKQGRLKPPAT